MHEIPLNDILGNCQASGVESYLKLGKLRKARREDGSTTSTMIGAKTTTNTAAIACSAALGAPNTPPAASRMLSTKTIMVNPMPHFLSSHKLAAPTRPTAPSTAPM